MSFSIVLTSFSKTALTESRAWGSYHRQLSSARVTPLPGLYGVQGSELNPHGLLGRAEQRPLSLPGFGPTRPRFLSRQSSGFYFFSFQKETTGSPPCLPWELTEAGLPSEEPSALSTQSQGPDLINSAEETLRQT